MFEEVSANFYSEPVVPYEDDEGIYGEETDFTSVITHGQDPYNASEQEDL